MRRTPTPAVGPTASESLSLSQARRIALRAVYARRWFRDTLDGLQRPIMRTAA